MGVGFGGGPADAPLSVSGTRAERYQVVLHVDDRTLAPRSHLDDGTRVSAETCRRLSCDASCVRIAHQPEGGSILSVGRRTRTIPPALRRALGARDRGCRFPACGSRFTDGHHVIHWADGGETSLANTLLLCHHHHRLVHEGGWQVDWWGEGMPVFFDPRGGAHFEGRRELAGRGADDQAAGISRKRHPPRGGDSRPDAGDGAPASAEALCRHNRRLGIIPDGRTAGARWKSGRPR